MSKRVQFAHSYPNVAANAPTDSGRTVVFAKADGLYVTLGSGDVIGPLGSGSAPDALSASIFDAAGDLIVGSGPDAAIRLPRGTDGTVLVSRPTGLVWEAGQSTISQVPVDLVGSDTIYDMGADGLASVWEDIPGVTATITTSGTARLYVESGYSLSLVSGNSASEVSVRVVINSTPETAGLGSRVFVERATNIEAGTARVLSDPVPPGTYTTRVQWRRITGTTTPRWERGSVMIQSMQGAQGPKGDPGTPGAPGPTITNYVTTNTDQSIAGIKNFTGSLQAGGVAVVVTTDARLSDARTPTSHTHLATEISNSTTVGRSVLTATDAAAARSAIGAGTSSFSGAYSALSGIPSSFAPTAHAATHATGGGDALTPAAIGAAPASHTHTAAQISDATTVGRGVLTAVDAAAARTAIGAGTSSFSGAYSALSGIPTSFTPSAHTHAIADLTATGTRDATTVLHGDGAWRAVSAAAPSNMLTTDTPQTITALKTIGNGEFDFARMTTEPPAPGTNNITLFAINDANGVTRLKLKYADGTTASMRAVEPYIFAVTGTLAARTGASRIYLEDNYVIESVRASVNTAPAGADILVDVNLNGTSIYTDQATRPRIVAGANTGASAPTNASVATGQYLTVDIDQVGTTAAGADLTVVIRLRRI